MSSTIFTAQKVMVPSSGRLRKRGVKIHPFHLPGSAPDVSTWWQMFNFVFLCPKRWFQFNSRTVRIHFLSIMTLNNWKMIAEIRSYIFRWRSRFRRRRVCLSSLMWKHEQGTRTQREEMYARAGRAEERSARHVRHLSSQEVTKSAAPRNLTVTGQWSSPSDYRVVRYVLRWKIAALRGSKV